MYTMYYDEYYFTLLWSFITTHSTILVEACRLACMSHQRQVYIAIIIKVCCVNLHKTLGEHNIFLLLEMYGKMAGKRLIGHLYYISIDYISMEIIAFAQ